MNTSLKNAISCFSGTEEALEANEQSDIFKASVQVTRTENQISLSMIKKKKKTMLENQLRYYKWSCGRKKKGSHYTTSTYISIFLYFRHILRKFKSQFFITKIKNIRRILSKCLLKNIVSCTWGSIGYFQTHGSTDHSKTT